MSTALLAAGLRQIMMAEDGHPKVWREVGALRVIRCYPPFKGLDAHQVLAQAWEAGWLVLLPPYPEDFFLDTTRLPQ